MNVSYAITVHNEGALLNTLLTQLLTDANRTDEVVILDDYSTDPVTKQYLVTAAAVGIKVHSHALNRDFAAHKNYLNTLCTGDYIFQLDADELIATELLTNLHQLLDLNDRVDLYFVPRVNTVEGLTPAHVAQWGWQVNEQGWVQWPDYQTRLYRNDPRIRWVGAVHERIEGFTTHAYLPADPAFALLHAKTIQRQEQQNALYATITR